MTRSADGRDTSGARPLRELRAERLLAVRDLARAVGVSPGTIDALEAGRSGQPGADLIRAIAAVLGVAPSAVAEFRPPADPAAPPSRAARILVVDDEDRLRRLVGRILDDTGYAVRMATNGAEALAFLPAWPPDLILLDLNMPIMDGRVFCLEVQRQPAFATIPIVIVSSDATSEAACAPCRPAAYLAKPFNPSTLLDTVDAILAGARPLLGEAPEGPGSGGTSLVPPVVDTS